MRTQVKHPAKTSPIIGSQMLDSMIEAIMIKECNGDDDHDDENGSEDDKDSDYDVFSNSNIVRMIQGHFLKDLSNY